MSVTLAPPLTDQASSRTLGPPLRLTLQGSVLRKDARMEGFQATAGVLQQTVHAAFCGLVRGLLLLVPLRGRDGGEPPKMGRGPPSASKSQDLVGAEALQMVLTTVSIHRWGN